MCPRHAVRPAGHAAVRLATRDPDLGQSRRAASSAAGGQRQIDLVGYSNGGRLAYRMACDDPGVYDQIAAVKAAPMPG